MFDHLLLSILGESADLPLLFVEEVHVGAGKADGINCKKTGTLHCGTMRLLANCLLLEHAWRQ
jgi:hypothetical protein